jgi:hypothetical protein
MTEEIKVPAWASAEPETYKLLTGNIETSDKYANERCPDRKKSGVASLRECVFLKDFMILNIRSVMKRLDEAQKRIEALEAHGIAYKGVHQRAIEYKRGEVVTSDGSAWIALVDEAKGKPGTNGDWQLFVKAGRDAR